MHLPLLSRYVPSSGFGLRTRLMIGFALFAMLPALLVVGVMVHLNEQVVTKTVATFVMHEDNAIQLAGAKASEVSQNTLNQTSARLISLDATGIQRMAAKLTRSSESQLRESNAHIVTLAVAANHRLAARLVALEHGPTSKMADRANSLAREETIALQAASRKTTDQAVAAMAAAGRTAVTQATTYMKERVQFVVWSIRRGYIQPQLKEVSDDAASKIPPLARDALTTFRSQTMILTVFLLLLTLLAAVIASYWLSSHFAVPIEVDERQKRAEIERYSHEMEIAARLQAALLPVDVSAPGFELALAMLPATEVGGDLLDYLPQADGTFWLAIGDVTGHGLTPGIVMMMAQSLFTGFVIEQPDSSPRLLLAKLNRALHQNIRYRLRNDQFMTLQLLRHHGDGCFSAAGLHCDILVHRAETGAVERIRVHGCWVGISPEIEDLLQEVHFQLHPGDTLVLYTDGLIEAANAHQEQFHLNRLEDAVGIAADKSPAEMKADILAQVQSWVAQQEDDISLIVLRRLAATDQVADEPMAAGQKEFIYD
ncbi:MAG: phosphoserine phosphatase [Cyanobacteria bacterium RYN_339]|nr:phosphoserine phosphatase [Cyanobacteria bacterium RYN_339]